MLDYDEALARVRAEIAKMPLPEEDALVVYLEHTIERPFGWVFFWGSEMYAKTGEFRYAMGGNAPYIVNRHSGTIVLTGTALPAEDYIRRYEADQA
jgi:hypothetical protein